MASNIFSQTQISASQSSKEVTANENFVSLKNGIRGLLSKSVAGNSNVTLTESEAENMMLELTGALTGNIELRVPAYSKFYSVYNNTSGSYSLTVKTPSGSGVIIKQGVRTLLYCDGTNVVNLSAQRLQGLEIDTTAPTDGYVLTWVAADSKIKWQAAPGAGSGAPNDAKYVVSESNGTLSAEIIIPAMAGHPDAKPASPQTEDDDFDAGSLDGKWSWTNQGTATATLVSSHLELKALAASGINMKAILQTAPSPTYTFGAKVSLLGKYADSMNGGLILYESGTGKLCNFSLIHYTSLFTNGFALAVYTYASTTVSATNRFSMKMPTMGPAYLKVTDNNTNLLFSYSLDGRNWLQVYSMARSTGFTTAPDRIGLGVSAEQTSSDVVLSVDWFRRLA